jgi:hypothetical protein
MVVTKKTGGSVVASPTWITLNSHQTTPSLTVLSTDPSHNGRYVITVKSRLYNESTFTPEFLFDIWMTPCQIAGLSLAKVISLIGNRE